jgi:hypothetical protein
LPDEIYALWPDKCSALFHAKNLSNKRPLVKKQLELDILLNGNVNLAVYCPHCYEAIHYSNLNWRNEQRAYIYGCSNCNQAIDYMLIDLMSFARMDSMFLDKLCESFAQRFVGKRVAIWGITNRIRRTLMHSQTLRDSLVKVVDIHWEYLSQQSYCGLKVESPDALRGVKFDSVLTGVVERRKQIDDKFNEWGVCPDIVAI